MCGVGENVAEALADRVYFLVPERVVLKGCGLKVDIDLVFWNTGSHQLTVTAEDVASVRLNTDRVTFQTVGDLRPILLFGSHGVEGFANDGKTNERQDDGNRHIARYHFVVVELAHISTRVFL